MGARSEVIRRRWAVRNQKLENTSGVMYNFRKQFANCRLIEYSVKSIERRDAGKSIHVDGSTTVKLRWTTEVWVKETTAPDVTETPQLQTLQRRIKPEHRSGSSARSRKLLQGYFLSNGTSYSKNVSFFIGNADR